MEFIYFEIWHLLQKCNTENIRVINKTIPRYHQFTCLGGILDSSLQFKAHITNKCKAAMVNLIWIKKHLEIHWQQHMPHINQIISSNSPRWLQFHTCRPAKKSINAMQSIQNGEAKIILNKRSRDSTIECLKELHWLPKQQRIGLKILKLIFK